jgi:hypothetical protein
MDVTLPSGGTAKLIDPGQLRATHRMKARRYLASGVQVRDDGTTDRTRAWETGSIFAMEVVGWVVQSWTLPYVNGGGDIPPPAANPPAYDANGDLVDGQEGWLGQIDCYDMNALEMATVEHQRLLMGMNVGREPDGVDDRGRPDPSGRSSPENGSEPASLESTPNESPRHAADTTTPGTEPTVITSGSNASS